MTIRKIVALVLARGGSKGIPKKNLALVRNETLISKAIKTIIKFGKFDQVWVSTDNDEIAAESLKSGSLVFKRSSEFATDDAPSISAVQEFIASNRDVDIVALIQCTSPFLQVGDLEKAYQMIVNDDFDSVFSVVENHNLLWKIKSNDSSMSPLNFHPTNRPRRQEMNNEFAETGMFYFAKRHLIKQGVLQGGKTGFVEIPKERALEIDTLYDLIIAEVLSTVIK